ncbi:MAG TPA: UDP-glucose/GDP-mannose dehydrogenase family protein [Gammaproteobacteria bacterium]|nr:UDP-glucose/GDP-mannose dehydrogenase family protein [Gammaproteobacteria bacterium]
MKVTVIGTGYVGLVSGTCLAEVGNDVLCIDTDQDKISGLMEGRLPIYEPGLETLVANNAEAGRLQFSTDIKAGVEHGEILFIAVGTPPEENGSADLQHVLKVAQDIGQHLTEYRVLVTKSTVPVGTADKVSAVVRNELECRGVEIDYSVVSNPEFLKEGAAVEDFLKPDRIVVGADDSRAIALMQALYAPFNRSHNRLIVMDVRSSELTKYAANALLATKISFINELSHVAERCQADIEKVRLGIGADPRIGYHFIYPGCGYGGSCFPKDVKALIHSASELGVSTQILQAVEAVNERQKQQPVVKLKQHFNGRLTGLRIALWGLAFKPNTDDMREAPSRIIMEMLWSAGANIVAFDPIAGDETARIYPEQSNLLLVDDPYLALEAADALLVITEWQQFRNPDFARMREAMAQAVIVDGRNIYDPAQMCDAGFTYYSIGRQ